MVKLSRVMELHVQMERAPGALCRVLAAIAQRTAQEGAQQPVTRLQPVLQRLDGDSVPIRPAAVRPRRCPEPDQA